MRPTLFQIYCNPHTIIEALDAAGAESAQAKVMRLMFQLAEYFSMKKYHDRIDRDRTNAYLGEQRRLRYRGSKPDPDAVRRTLKQVGEYNKTIIVTRGYLRRTAKKLEAKVTQWPDLSIDEATLSTRPDYKTATKVLKKRMKKGKPRTQVLG